MDPYFELVSIIRFKWFHQGLKCISSDVVTYAAHVNKIIGTIRTYMFV